VKWLIRTILVSRAYQMPAVARTAEPPARNYAFDGPEIRRMTAEQFVDAIGAITGEWSVYQPRTPPGSAPRDPLASDPPTSGVYGREWRAASSTLTRALGRPIRDQVISTRAAQSTTPQALELVNGEMLTAWLSRGAQRLIGRLPDEPLSLYNKAVAGRNATSSRFDVDITGASRLWLVVHDFGSNAPERVEPLWSQVELVGPDGAVPLTKLTPVNRAGLRVARAAAAGTTPVPPGPLNDDVRVKNPSQLVYDVSARGFTRLRGTIAIDNPRSEIGSTLNPQVRFFVFDHAPNLERLIPTAPASVPMPAAPVVTSRADAVDRVFRHALGRAPNAAERQLAVAAITDAAHPGRPSAGGLADLLWAVLMKPEFQLIY
jgi:hypothetical protein